MIQKIDGGELVEGDKLPSEISLAQSLQVARATIVKALEIMQERGYISPGERGKRRQILGQNTRKSNIENTVRKIAFLLPENKEYFDSMIAELNQKYDVWVELGVQTANDDTLDLINRGHHFEAVRSAVTRLHEHGIKAAAHVILGLPGEDTQAVLETMEYLNQLPIQGIKLQLLHVLKGTDLASLQTIAEDTLSPTLERIDGKKGAQLGPYQLTVYDGSERVPSWFGEGMTYQIFPDRFHRTSIPNPAGMVGDRVVHQDWEELTADVFLAAWENRRKLQPEKVKGWLAVTMRNRCINRLRALREEELPLEEDLLTLTADSPQRALEDQEAARLVREALDTLERTDRELFVRRYYYGQTVARAAEEMGLNLSTAKSRLRRGREKLKELLGKAGYEFEAD